MSSRKYCNAFPCCGAHTFQAPCLDCAKRCDLCLKALTRWLTFYYADLACDMPANMTEVSKATYNHYLRMMSYYKQVWPQYYVNKRSLSDETVFKVPESRTSKRRLNKGSA